MLSFRLSLRIVMLMMIGLCIIFALVAKISNNHVDLYRKWRDGDPEVKLIYFEITFQNNKIIFDTEEELEYLNSYALPSGGDCMDTQGTVNMTCIFEGGRRCAVPGAVNPYGVLFLTGTDGWGFRPNGGIGFPEPIPTTLRNEVDNFYRVFSFDYLPPERCCD